MFAESRLEKLGLVLPAPLKPPGGVELPFPWIRIQGSRAFISGHGPQNPDGTLAGPFGKVGAEVSVEEAKHSAQLVGLSILGSLKRELGDLDRVESWLKILGMVNSAPDFREHPSVINGFSELILEVYGKERGRHARSAVGMAQLPFDIPVEIEGEVAIRD